MPWQTRRLTSMRFALIASCLAVTNFLMVFDGLVVTVALPVIQRGFGFTALEAQWVLTAYTIPLGGMLLLGGRAGDRFGRRRMLVLGMVVFVAGLLGAGLAQSLGTMLAARALQGLGSALAIPNTYALTSAIEPVDRRNRAFAAIAVAGGGAAACGAVVGGLITDALGWRQIFFLSMPIAVLAAVVAPRLLPPGRAEQSPARLDATAAVLCTFGLTMLVFAITSIEAVGLFAPLTVAMAVAALVTLMLFVFRERHAAAPLLKPALLRVRTVRAATAGMPGQVSAYVGTLFLGLLFFQQVKGYTALEAGLAFAPLGVAASVVSSFANRLLSFGRWPIVSASASGLCVLGLLWLGLAPADGSYAGWYLPPLILIGLGIVGAVPLNAAVGREVGGSDKGTAYGLFETSTHISSAIVIAGLATIAAARSRIAATPDAATALAAGYRLAFLVTAGIVLVGAMTTLLYGLRSERLRQAE